MADYVYVQESGVIMPDTADLQTTVEDEYKTVFGSNLVVTPNTPQGVLITAEVIARANVLANNAALANQINPNLAGGVFLDAIWALTGGGRLAATQSTIAGVILGGVGGTLVPAGTVAAQADGTEWESVSDVVLDPGTGLATVDFVAVEFGPLACNIGALSVVVSGVLGWETVTNPNAAIPGRFEESDGASRIRRRNTLALQGSGGPEAIISHLYNTPGVRSLAFRENVTDADLIIEGVTLVEHSIYACVDGGTDADVAMTLLDTKSMGANWNGTTTVNVVEPASGQTYAVKFSRPVAVPILARATVRVMGATGDIDALVKSALMAYVNGLLEGEAGLTVGTDVSPFELAGAVNVQTPGIYVQKMEITTVAAAAFAVAEIPILISQIATLVEAGITVIVL